MNKQFGLLFVILIATIKASAFQSHDSVKYYKEKIISYYHNHRNSDVYKAYGALKNLPGDNYDSTIAKMVVVSGIRLLQSRATDIDPQLLIDAVTPLIAKDKRWLHFRADIYNNLAMYTKDGAKAAQYANLKQADMVAYDYNYSPYEYNKVIP